MARVFLLAATSGVQPKSRPRKRVPSRASTTLGPCREGRAMWEQGQSGQRSLGCGGSNSSMQGRSASLAGTPCTPAPTRMLLAAAPPGSNSKPPCGCGHSNQVAIKHTMHCQEKAQGALSKPCQLNMRRCCVHLQVLVHAKGKHHRLNGRIIEEGRQPVREAAHATGAAKRRGPALAEPGVWQRRRAGGRLQQRVAGWAGQGHSASGASYSLVVPRISPRALRGAKACRHSGAC